jgi:serine/threonine-protein kinase
MRPDLPVPPPVSLLDAAALVADGSDLDWGTMTSRLATDDERALADVLASVARIAREHRRLHDLRPDAGTAPAGSAASWGHLSLLEVLGRGAYGTVYRAWDGRLDRQVAVKLFQGSADPEDVIREGRMLAKVRHDNVVSVYGADVIDGVAGVWMECLRGRNLFQIVKEQGPLSAREACLVGLDVARAMAAVHAAGLLHCDVKAQNVVREPGGRVVLMDLGAGRPATLPLAESISVALSGTPLYMAPELFRREPATHQSDIYSVGVLLFFLASGEYPVSGKSLGEIRAAHAEGRRRHLRDVRPDLPNDFLREVSRALDPDPTRRHASAGALEEALTRVLAPAEEARPATTKRMSRRGWLAIAAFAALVTALVAGAALVTRPPARGAGEARTVAVLPLRNLTGDAGKTYIADGVTDVLISNLVRIKALRIPSLSAVLPYRNTTESSRVIADKLQADVLLAGSIMEAGDSVRVSVQLIDPASDTAVWSRDLTKPASELLSLQGEIARLVAAHLAVTLSPAENRGLSQGALNPEAQDAYLRGLAASEAVIDLHTGELAVAYLRRATELEPGFADAWAQRALAELRVIELVADADRPARAAAARELAEQALRLAPNSANAFIALGTTQFNHQWDFDGAERMFRLAVEHAPNAVVAWRRLSLLLAARNRLPEAIDAGTRARDLEPLLPSAHTSLGLLYYYARDYTQAEAELHRALAISPAFTPAHFALGRVYSAMGRHAEAIERFHKSLAATRRPSLVVELARAYTAAGQTSEAAVLLAELDRRRERGEGFSLDNLAYIAAADGRIDEAFSLLDRAIEQRLTNVLWIAVDPRVDPLRADPRFARALTRMGLETERVNGTNSR